jgi:predicted RNA-binding protein with PIN domain
MGRDRARDNVGGASRRLPAEEAAPDRFRWIVDGHNAIFAVPEWEELQVAGQRREARHGLEESLEAFGRAIGARITVVYDGNHLDRNPDAVSWPHLRTEYSFPPEEADDRIRFLAERSVRDGEHPVVVTSDRRTLAATLAPGIRSMDVRHFFRRVHARALFVPEKRPVDGLDEIERHFLSLSPHAQDRREAEQRGPGTETPGRDGETGAGDRNSPGGRTGPGGRSGPRGTDDRGDGGDPPA